MRATLRQSRGSIVIIQQGPSPILTYNFSTNFFVWLWTPASPYKWFMNVPSGPGAGSALTLGGTLRDYAYPAFGYTWQIVGQDESSNDITPVSNLCFA